MADVKVDWIKIRIEYETTNLSYRKIADKCNVSFNTLKGRASREGWAKSKEEAHHKITTTTRQKTVVKIADRNAKILSISDMATEAIEEYLKEKHYKQHVYKEKKYYEGKVDSEEIVCKELDVADTKALANMVSSLDKLQKGQRLAEGLDNKDKNNVQSNIAEELKKARERVTNGKAANRK